jgi:predicted RNase H-like HicB family nuclease
MSCGGRDGSSAWLGLVFAEAYDRAMGLNLTAVFQKVPEGYIGFVEELPGANTQGATLEEARANLQEAVALVLEANRGLIEETTQGGEVIREPLKVGA